MTEATKPTRILTRMMDSIRAPKLDPVASKELLRPTIVIRTLRENGQYDDETTEGKE